MKDKMRDKMRTVGASAGTALLAVMMVGIVAFGASTLRPLSAGTAGTNDQPDATPKAEVAWDAAKDQEGGYKPVKDQKPAAEPTDKPKPEPEPTKKPRPEPKATDKPQPEPEPTEKPKETDPPKPETSVLGLETWTKGSYVKLAWTKYLADGFEYYKVVRSKDATVTWPAGEKDALLAAIGDPHSPWWADQPPCGYEFHYRVFAVRHSESGYVVLAASNTVGGYVECGEEPAEPKAIGLDAWVGEDGKVHLAWEGCATDGFWAYKVVRSAVNEAPTYPLKDGDELIAAIGDPGQTSFADADVAPGETWTYRVLALGEGGAVLCISPARSVTLE